MKQQEQILEFEIKEEQSWDFKDSNTKEYTHRIHTYPAMMIPQISRRLISLYGKDATNLLDPFMGSGTSLVEASLVSNIKNAYGFDLNPLAVLISKVKTTILNPSQLEKEMEIILRSKDFNNISQFKNIQFWFKPQVIKNLTLLKNAINNIQDKDIKDFFVVTFSETVRDVSNTRNKEFKLYRIEENKLKNYNPDVLKQFEKIAKNNIQGLKDYIKVRTITKVEPKYFNSMNSLQLNDNSVDLIVTSPPYGDSRTTVAYGQFSRLALQWLDYVNVNDLDNKLLGGKASKELEVKINSNSLKSIIKRITEKDPKRSKEILSFYEDFDKVVIQLDRVIAKKGYVCFVVGNRTVKNINIPTDKIMMEMFMSHGDYKYVTTYVRNIPHKRMPKSNSPSNKIGEKITTMNNEFIFVLQKI